MLIKKLEYKPLVGLLPSGGNQRNETIKKKHAPIADIIA
jgi:hypothetical protein